MPLYMDELVEAFTIGMTLKEHTITTDYTEQFLCFNEQGTPWLHLTFVHATASCLSCLDISYHPNITAMAAIQWMKESGQDPTRDAELSKKVKWRAMLNWESKEDTKCNVVGIKKLVKMNILSRIRYYTMPTEFRLKDEMKELLENYSWTQMFIAFSIQSEISHVCMKML